MAHNHQVARFESGPRNHPPPLASGGGVCFMGAWESGRGRENQNRHLFAEPVLSAARGRKGPGHAVGSSLFAGRARKPLMAGAKRLGPRRRPLFHIRRLAALFARSAVLFLFTLASSTSIIRTGIGTTIAPKTFGPFVPTVTVSRPGGLGTGQENGPRCEPGAFLLTGSRLVRSATDCGSRGSIGGGTLASSVTPRQTIIYQAVA